MRFQYTAVCDMLEANFLAFLFRGVVIEYHRSDIGKLISSFRGKEAFMRRNSGMRIMTIGEGGREHAIVWKLSQSPTVGQIYAVPGNPGIAEEPKTTCLLVPPDHASLVGTAREYSVDLVVIGPDAPLAAGLADAFEDAGILVLGPRKRGARIEASKCFAKDFMASYGIPTAPYRWFDSLAPAEEYIRGHPLPVVVKADGLARGKGTTIAESTGEAIAAARKWLSRGRIVVEEFLNGEEASFTRLVAGGAALPLPSSQDHKRLWDGDRGPMTGGMGAYSPAPVVDAEVEERVYNEILVSFLRGLEVEMISYTGFLYIGLMIVGGRPYVLEFNCRLGDPEAQAILMRFNGDLAQLLLNAASGKLERAVLGWDPRPAVTVVLAAAGYPNEPRKQDVISGLQELGGQDVKVFHAGTEYRNGKLVTVGGRVLALTALGETVTKAQDVAYRTIGKIHFPGMQYRKDIGHRAVAREVSKH